MLICLLAYSIAAGIVYFTVPYFSTDDTLLISLEADVFATVVIFLFSLAFRNSSLYDPYWSVIPPILIYFWMVQSQNFTLLSTLLLMVVMLWSIRLTFNWIRGWKGITHEDWRYTQLRNDNPRIYPLINFSGIHLFPTVIVFIALLPFYFSILKTSSFTFLHVAGLVVSFIGFLIQLVADEQLYAWRRKEQTHSCLNTGLWKFSRHPNYLGEIVFWWGGWFVAMGTDVHLYWTAIGPLLLTGMFVFISIPMIEKRHLERRPCYQEILRQVPMLIGRKSKQ